MKFCFFTDIHVTGRAPERRKDDYIDTIIKKLNFIAENTNDVDFYICGGDIFHMADPATSSVREVAAAFKKFNKPIYTAVGSHDLVGYQFSTIKRSAIGVLDAAGLIKIVPDKIVIDDVVFYFSHHSYQGDKHPESYLLGVDLDYKNSVHVIHGSFYTKKIFDSVHSLDSYPNLGSMDLVLCGHIHHPFTNSIDGTRFYNPGSLTRTAVDQTHQIKAAIITHKKNILPMHAFEIKDLMIPYEVDVFLNNAHTANVNDLTTIDFSEVFNEVDAIKIKDATNLKEIISDLDGVDEATKETCFDILGSVSSGK